MIERVLAFCLVILAFGIFWIVVAAVVMALVLLRPPRMNDAKAMIFLRRLSPSDLGLDFEEVSYVVVDTLGQKLRLAGWWIARPRSEKCVVLVHGYGDAKVGAIAWAPLLNRLGFNILAIDLRAHGESQGKWCTAGYFEREDLAQVIDRLRIDRPGETRQLALFGISMGAAVAAAVAVDRSDLAAVVLECPYLDFPTAAAAQAIRLGAPIGAVRPLVDRIAQWIARCDFGQVRPVDLIPKIPCPLMIVQCCDDPFVSERDMAQLRQAASSRRAATVFWALENVHHVVGMCADPQKYEDRIAQFFSDALPTPVEVCETKSFRSGE